MVHAQLSGVLNHIRQAADARGGGPTDAELLGRFAAHRDHTAFELLVWRHGAMVLQTCRRLLARPEDAEDAFQATFLALVRRVKSIHRGQAVAGWLHTVACRVALRARAAAARRACCERQAINGTDPKNGHEPAVAHPGFDSIMWAEVRELIDQELSRLPKKLRDPFVLCCLEGLTNEEAARQLGCPKGTVLSRLSRARERLRGRLVGRGLGLPAGALAAALCQEASACLAPAPLVVSTVKATTLVAAGQATASVVAAPVAALTEGVLKAMFLTKLKMIAATVVVVGVVAAGSGGLVQMTTAAAQVVQKEPPRKSQPPGKQDADRAAQADIHAARAVFLATEQAVKAAEQTIGMLEAQLLQAKEELKVRKEINAEARRRLDIELRLAKKNAPTEPEPKKPNPPQTPPAKQPPQTQPPAMVDRVTFPAGASTDLIQLASVYVDAIRDFETAKIRAAPTKGISQEESAIRAINMKAGERKVELLRAIAEAALRGADGELQIARTRHNAGDRKGSVEQVNAAQTKVDVLRLILGSAK